MTRSRVGFLAAAMLLAGWGQAPRLHAQAEPTMTHAGGYIAVGGTLSEYQSAYNKDQVSGFTGFVDANLTRRLGVEGEARLLPWQTQEQTRSTTYLVGPRISMTWPRFRPYVKGLVGTGKFTYPFHYAEGSYLVLAPGAGLDVALHGRASIRVIDFEYQDWHHFNFGRTRPYGFSSGVSFRIF